MRLLRALFYPAAAFLVQDGMQANPNILELPSAGLVACQDLPVEPRARCKAGVRVPGQDLKVCPGAPDAKRVYDPNAAGAQRNFQCADATPICCAEEDQKMDPSPGDPVTPTEVGGEAAVGYAKYQADLAAYRQVFPEMSNCEGMTREDCLAGEAAVMDQMWSFCEDMEGAEQTKCVLTSIQNRLATSGLHYTYDSGEVPESMQSPLNGTIFADDARPMTEDGELGLMQEYGGDVWKDPYVLMQDEQGDCDDVGILMMMYCQQAISAGLLDGECVVAMGWVGDDDNRGGHAFCIFKDAATNEAYVLDGVYFQDTDSFSITNDASWNPDELMSYTDYMSDCGETGCANFESWKNMITVSDPACWTGPDACEFIKVDHTDTAAWISDGSTADTTLIQDSISGTDLKDERWDFHGLSAPIDKFDLEDVGTFLQAQYVATTAQFFSPAEITADTFINSTVDGLDVAGDVIGGWVSALFALRQLHKSQAKRRSLKRLDELLEKDDAWWAKQRLKGKQWRKLAHLLADVFCADNPDKAGAVDCAGSAAEGPVGHAIAVFHRRDQSFATLTELCGHVAERLEHLEAAGGPLAALPEDALRDCKEVRDDAPSWQVERREARLHAAAALVGLKWEAKRKKVSLGKRLRGVEPPIQYKLKSDDRRLCARMEAHIEPATLRAFLVANTPTIKVLRSLSKYNQYEQDYWAMQSLWKAGATAALSLVPLFGAVDFVRAHFYLRSAAYYNTQLQALRNRVSAARYMIRKAPACKGTGEDAGVGEAFRDQLHKYRDREWENVNYLQKKDTAFAIIHILSGISAGPAMTLGPIGTLIRTVSRGVLKLATTAGLGIYKKWKLKKLPPINVAEVFDDLGTFPDPRCRSTLAWALFDLTERQYEEIGKQNWIRKGVFVPSMTVPSFVRVKLWKTNLPKGFPLFLRNRRWKWLREAKDKRVGFGLHTEIECEPQPSCRERKGRLARSRAQEDVYFLRVEGWKTGGAPSRDRKPPKSAVRRWNKRNPAQQVHLNDIVLMVRGGSPVAKGKDRLQQFDEEDKNMRISLTVLPGFITYPTLSDCDGRSLGSETFDFDPGDPNAPTVVKDHTPSKLGAALQGKVKATALKRPHRVPECERKCLQDPACDAVVVVLLPGEDGSMSVLCELLSLGDDAADGTAEFMQLDGEVEQEPTCWMRTTLAKADGSKAALPPASRTAPAVTARREQALGSAFEQAVKVPLPALPASEQRFDAVRELLERKLSRSGSHRAFTLEETTAVIAKTAFKSPRFQFTRDGLIMVHSIAPGNPLLAAGVQNKDYVLEVCGEDASQASLISLFKACGKDVVLRVARMQQAAVAPDAARREVRPAALSEAPGRVLAQMTELYRTHHETELTVDVEYGPSADVEFRQDGLVVVQAVEEAGPAFRAGFRPGDVILSACGQDVSQASFDRVFRLCAADREPVTFAVLRPEGQDAGEAGSRYDAYEYLARALFVPSAGGVACADLPIAPKPRCLPGPSGRRSDMAQCPPGLRALLDPNHAGAQRDFGCERGYLCCAPPLSTKQAGQLRAVLGAGGAVVEKAFVEVDQAAASHVLRRQS